MISPGESDRVSALSASCSICAAVRRGNRIGSSGSRKPSTGVGEVYSLITASSRRTRRRLGSASGRDAPGLTVGRRSRVNRPGGSARRPLHERADPCLCGGGQLLQRKRGRPHGALVEVRLVAEAERSAPRVELLGALEEADDLAVLVGVRGHPVPGLRRELWCARLDDLVEPLGHGAIRLRHLGDLREHGAFPIRLLRFRLLLFGALPHRGPFLGRESLGLLHAHRSLPCGFFRVLLSGSAVHALRILTDGAFPTPSKGPRPRSCAPGTPQRGTKRRTGATRTSENSVMAKFADHLKAEVGVPRHAVTSPRQSTNRRRRRGVDFLRKRLPTQVGRYLQGVQFPARKEELL